MVTRESTIIAIAVAIALAAGTALGEAERPDFSGYWELNAERSDDAREKEREGQRLTADTGRGGASRGGHRSRRLPAGAGGRQAEPESGKLSWLTLLSGYGQDLRIVQVEHGEPDLRITSAMPGTSFTQLLHTDERPFERSGSGTEGSARARWQRGGRLVVELEAPDGRALTETWELVAEGSRLLMTAKLEGGRLLPDVTYQRVYDRVEIIEWDVAE